MPKQANDAFPDNYQIISTFYDAEGEVTDQEHAVRASIIVNDEKGDFVEHVSFLFLSPSSPSAETPKPPDPDALPVQATSAPPNTQSPDLAANLTHPD